MAVSRQREFLADATSVRLTRHPQGLISALEKLATQARPFAGANRATQHMFIVNPLSAGSLMHLFSTHPPLEERIARLTGMRPGNTPSTGSSSRDEMSPEERAKRQAEETWKNLSR